MSAPGVADEIVGFFDDFVETFGSFNGVRSATRYVVPGVALRGDGSIHYLQSRAEVEGFFQAAVESYHCDGCRGIRWRQSCNLVRVDASWQILASTYHVGSS